MRDEPSPSSASASCPAFGCTSSTTARRWAYQPCTSTGLRRNARDVRQLLGPELLPQPAGVAERRDAALGGDARAGEHGHALGAGEAFDEGVGERRASSVGGFGFGPAAGRASSAVTASRARASAVSCASAPGCTLANLARSARRRTKSSGSSASGGASSGRRASAASSSRVVCSRAGTPRRAGEVRSQRVGEFDVERLDGVGRSRERGGEGVEPVAYLFVGRQRGGAGWGGSGAGRATTTVRRGGASTASAASSHGPHARGKSASGARPFGSAALGGYERADADERDRRGDRRRVAAPHDADGHGPDARRVERERRRLEHDAVDAHAAALCRAGDAAPRRVRPRPPPAGSRPPLPRRAARGRRPARPRRARRPRPRSNRSPTVTLSASTCSRTVCAEAGAASNASRATVGHDARAPSHDGTCLVASRRPVALAEERHERLDVVLVGPHRRRCPRGRGRAPPRSPPAAPRPAGRTPRAPPGCPCPRAPAAPSRHRAASAARRPGASVSRGSRRWTATTSCRRASARSFGLVVRVEEVAHEDDDRAAAEDVQDVVERGGRGACRGPRASWAKRSRMRRSTWRRPFFGGTNRSTRSENSSRPDLVVVADGAEGEHGADLRRHLALRRRRPSRTARCPRRPRRARASARAPPRRASRTSRPSAPTRSSRSSARRRRSGTGGPRRTRSRAP